MEENKIVEEIGAHFYKFYDENKEKRTTTNLKTFIKKIDDVPLNVLFFINTLSSYLGFMGQSKKIVDEDGDSLILFQFDVHFKTPDGQVNKEIFLDFAKKVVYFLQNAKLNENGRITVENDTLELRLDKSFANINSTNFELEKVEECCVCYRSTRTKTLCNHSLCFKCWFSINTDEDENINCPLCRSSIFECHLDY